MPSYSPVAIPDFATYADYVGTQDNLDGFYEPFNAIPGGVYYADKVITDHVDIQLLQEAPGRPQQA
jgi:hypothetical protein